MSADIVITDTAPIKSSRQENVLLIFHKGNPDAVVSLTTSLFIFTITRFPNFTYETPDIPAVCKRASNSFKADF